jgi:hypothetical protein
MSVLVEHQSRVRSRFLRFTANDPGEQVDLGFPIAQGQGTHGCPFHSELAGRYASGSDHEVERNLGLDLVIAFKLSGGHHRQQSQSQHKEPSHVFHHAPPKFWFRHRGSGAILLPPREKVHGDSLKRHQLI